MFKSNSRRRYQYVPRNVISDASYRERQYKRPLIFRLKPFTWFLITLCVLSVVGMIGMVINRQAQNHEETILLTDRLAGIAGQTQTNSAQSVAPTAVPAVIITSTQIAPTAVVTQATPQPSATPTTTVFVSPTATLTPTYNVGIAPWKDQLVRQQDGSLQAPEVVQARVRNELGEYYQLLRNLSLLDYLKQRDGILNTYFAGSALKGMQQIEIDRKQYLMNRAGTVYIDVRDFAANGLGATIGIRASGWVNDVYDVVSGNVITKGLAVKDTFAVVEVVFEQTSNRWKYAIVKLVTEVEKP